MSGKAKWSFCLAIIAVFAASTAHADVMGIDSANTLYGSVVITSGSAFYGIDGAYFIISGGGLSASTFANFDIEGIEGIPILDGNFYLPIPDIQACNTSESSGSYLGAQAACLGPMGVPGEPDAEVHITETSLSVSPNHVGSGTFTASGNIVGYSPAECANRLPIDCVEDFDVQVTGEGTFSWTPDTTDPSSGWYVYSEGLDFTPPSSIPTPEPRTAVLFGAGALVLAAFSLSKRWRAHRAAWTH